MADLQFQNPAQAHTRTAPALVSARFPGAATRPDRTGERLIDNELDEIPDEDLPFLPAEQYHSVWEAILARL